MNKKTGLCEKRKMESVSKRIYRAEMFHVKHLRENAHEKENGLRISTKQKILMGRKNVPRETFKKRH